MSVKKLLLLCWMVGVLMRMCDCEVGWVMWCFMFLGVVICGRVGKGLFCGRLCVRVLVMLCVCVLVMLLIRVIMVWLVM